MSAAPTLTPELEQQIVAAIRAGGFPHVAAAAFGVSPARLERWLAAGRRRKAREPYRSFARNLDRAHAHARLHAEAEALRLDPRLWLRGGPGKEQPGRPGWTGFVNPRHSQAGAGEDVVSVADLLHFLAVVCTVLDDYPGATDRVLAEVRAGVPRLAKLLPPPADAPPA